MKILYASRVNPPITTEAGWNFENIVTDDNGNQFLKAILKIQYWK